MPNSAHKNVDTGVVHSHSHKVAWPSHIPQFTGVSRFKYDMFIIVGITAMSAASHLYSPVPVVGRDTQMARSPAHANANAVENHADSTVRVA